MDKGDLPPEPDRLSAQWLVALATRSAREVSALLADARRRGRPLATFTIDGEIRFATAADRSAFARKLADRVAELLAEYDDRSVAGGRDHRLMICMYPALPVPADSAETAG